MIRIVLLLLLLTTGCSSYLPVYDPTSSSSHSYFDDLQECRFLIEEQSSSFEYGYYEVRMVSRCMTNRGYAVLNGE